MMKTLVVVLLLQASSVLADEPVKGTICFGKDCTSVTGSTFDVRPAGIERRFVWTSTDALRVVLGRLAANATTVDLSPKDARNVTLSVRGDAQRGWPVETRFAIAESPDQQWRWTIPAKLTGKAMSIRVTPGAYTMMIGADHHKGVRRQLKVDARDVDLREIILGPVPAVAGRVVTVTRSGDGGEPKETAVAGVQVARSDGKIIAATDEQGAFRAELLEPLTKELVFLSLGLATRVVPLNILATDTDLGVVKLSSGVKLSVHLVRADALKAKGMRAVLAEASKTEYENTNIATREVKPGEDDVVFPDLSEGTYYVTLTGDGPLEKLTTAIPVKTQDVSEQIHLKPFQLRGTVHLGNDPLHEGTVGVHDRDHTWTVDLPIDTEGRFGGTMWQADGIGGWVNSKETGSLPIDEAPILTGDPALWEVRFRRRFIAGRIFDEETKMAVPSASMHLQLETRSDNGMGMSQLYTGVRVDNDGTYSIAATRDGIYDVSVTTPDHVVANKTIELKQDDGSSTTDFPLTRGMEQVIDFVWATGEPVAQGFVIEGVARDGHNPGWSAMTDGNGRLSLRMRSGERKTLFIVPRQGSFAVVHVAAGEETPMRMVVPQPVGSLVMNFQDSDRKPVLAGAAIRWNGEWLPASVVGRLNITRLDPGSLRFALLPSGSYELWGMHAGRPALAPPPREPVHVGLSGGEQTVEITVAK